MNDSLQGLSAEKRALLAKRLRVAEETYAIVNGEPVAVIGMACRFPGGIQCPEDLWRLLVAGRDAVGPLPESRARFWHGDAGEAPCAGYLDEVDGFDADYFEISPREAIAMDPQQRILLEVACEALSDAGIASPDLSRSATGIFLGACIGDYSRLQFEAGSAVDAYTISGSSDSIIANRVSYALDFAGPSIAIDTACSSSLVAVHLACQSLRTGDSDTALAGGVNLILSPDLHRSLQAWGVLAGDHRCKVFDARADGFVRSEGCGVVVLRRLADAIAAGDRVLAVIRGTAVNQDGRSNGLTAPSVLAQEQVIRRALSNAGLDAGEISYVEAHGTGTALGDPIELDALRRIFGGSRRAVCLGALKANLGHMEAASGVGGLIKTVLAIRQRSIPGQLHFDRLNPHIDFEGTPFVISPRAQTWECQGKRVAGVSAFGFGGTNAHVIVEESGTPLLREPLARRTWQHKSFWIPNTRHIANPPVQDSLDSWLYKESWMASDAPAAPAQARRFAVLGNSRFAELLVRLGHSVGENGDVVVDFRRSLKGLLELAQTVRSPIWVVASADDPEQASLWGFAKTLAIERPDRWGGIVDANDEEQVAAEILSSGPDRLVKYRDGRRLTPMLVPAKQGTQPVAIRSGGTYLVTGGSRGIGLVCARWLADRGAGCVILLARRPPSEPLPSALEFRPGDISNPRALDGLPGLSGVIHAAGMIDDGVIASLDWGRVERVFAPKVEGAWNLHRAADRQPLDFMVFFSSIASLLGSAGQAAYAAANAALDAIARHRTERGLRTVSIQWGPWMDVGMAAGRRTGDGIDGIPPALGIRLLEAALSQAEPVVAALRVDSKTFRGKSMLGRTPMPLPGEARSPGKPQPSSQPRDLCQVVQEELATVLKLDAPPEPRRGFKELGMDSLSMLEFRNRLEVALNRTVPSTVLFEYPNLASLTQYLSQGRLDGESSKDDGLDRLSEDELLQTVETELLALQRRAW